MGSSSLESGQDAAVVTADAQAQSLSEAFAREFGEKPVEREAAKGSTSAIAKIVDRHFEELANLAERRDGLPSFGFSAVPRTVSYNDLKEMERLADQRRGLENYYSAEEIDSMRFSHLAWSRVGGTGCGVVAGGLARLAVPLLHGRGAAITLGVMALAGAAGYMAGDYIGNKTFDSFANNSTYLSNEKEKYGEELGTAWRRNARFVGGAGIMSGAIALGLGAPRIAVGLALGGMVTYLGGPVAYKLGQYSAEAELDRESLLGRRLEEEWKNR